MPFALLARVRTFVDSHIGPNVARRIGESADPELAAKYAGLEVPIALKLLSDRLLELNACRCEGTALLRPAIASDVRALVFF